MELRQDHGGRSAGVEDAAAAPESPAPRKAAGMTAREAEYMRGDKKPVAGSVPMSTSKYLNSPLFVHAFTTMALRRNGTDVAVTYNIPDMSRGVADVTDYAEAQQAIDTEKESNPAFREWLERRRLASYDPDQMRRHAPGTLGAAIRSFMVDSGMRLDFVDADVVPRNDIEYIRKRIGNSHDIHHMVSGFGPNPMGEMALSLMNITSNHQYLNPDLATFLNMPMIFTTSTSYARNSLHYGRGMSIYLDAMRMGIAAGQAIRMPFFMVDFEDYLDWQLDDIARDLGFERGPGQEAWSFTEELMRD